MGHPKTLQPLGKGKMLAISLTSTHPIDPGDPKKVWGGHKWGETPSWRDPWGAPLNWDTIKVGHPKTLHPQGKRKMLAIRSTYPHPIDPGDPK